jgi:hypothetical protein
MEPLEALASENYQLKLMLNKVVDVDKKEIARCVSERARSAGGACVWSCARGEAALLLLVTGPAACTHQHQSTTPNP